jgi:hypothetical protein
VARNKPRVKKKRVKYFKIIKFTNSVELIILLLFVVKKRGRRKK